MVEPLMAALPLKIYWALGKNNKSSDSSLTGLGIWYSVWAFILKSGYSSFVGSGFSIDMAYMSIYFRSSAMDWAQLSNVGPK